MYGSGDLDRKVRLIELVETGQSQSGQAQKQPTVRATPFAKITTLAGKKLEIARQMVPLATHEIVINYRRGIVPSNWQVEYQGKAFNVEAVNDVHTRHEWLMLTCVEQR